MKVNKTKFYRLPLWVRWICIFVLNIRPNNEPITREQEIIWDYLAAKNNHK